MRLSSNEPIDTDSTPARDPLQDYVGDPPDPMGDDYQAVQRAGLRELARLAGPVVEPLTGRVESQWLASSRTAREKHDKLSAEAHSGQRRRIEAIETGNRTALDQQQRQFEQKKHKLTARAEDELDTLEVQAKGILREATQNRDYELMTAETVARESMAKTRRDHNIFTEQIIPQAQEMMDGLEQRSGGLFKTYRGLIGKTAPASQDSTEPAPPEDAAAAFRGLREEAGGLIEKLARLFLPKLFAGPRPWLAWAGLTGLAVGTVWMLEWLKVEGVPPFRTAGPAAGVVTAGVLIGLGILLRRKATAQVRAIHQPLIGLLEQARRAMTLHIERTEAQYRQIFADIKKRHDEDVARHSSEFETIRKKQTDEHQSRKTRIQTELKQALDLLQQEQAQSAQALERERQNQVQQAQQQIKQRVEELAAQYEAETADQKAAYELAWGQLTGRWRAGLDRVGAMLDGAAAQPPVAHDHWDDPAWSAWKPDRIGAGAVRIGEFRPDWSALSQAVRDKMTADPRWQKCPPLPAVLSFPDRACLLLESRREGREAALTALKAVVARVMVSLPPGRARLTLVDPVGLGENFAGFMHLADYEEALIGGRIWTEPQQIQQQLSDLTGHMENVIQKYLRNEYETIEDYNRQAGELAEPYRFLVIADFPAKISEEAARRLASIIASGPRCGVFTLIACDIREKLPEGIRLEDIEAHSIVIRHREDRFEYADAVLGRVPLVLDRAPDDELLTGLMRKVGVGARETSRVEVPFESIAPPEDRMWSLHSEKVLTVPVGRTGATRRQAFTLGKGVAQHALIGGKTGSGKSTLLHVLITNLALWYSPDEVEMYLIDFKKGVEFKTYVTNALPHARAVAIESDREFGLSILRQIDGEMTRRGEQYRRAGVQDLAGWRGATGKPMPRILLIVDEFQVFFSEDDKLAQDAALLLEQLVRQGRAFGIHVVLGSQTLAGTSGLARGTLGQIAVRVALQCSEADSQLILEDNNTAARLLGRPGEAIYNDAGGLVQGNSPFQVSWLEDDLRDGYLGAVRQRYEQAGLPPRSMVVFEGNIPADIRKNRPLANALASPPAAMPATGTAWIGEPVAIKEPTAVTFARQSGANGLIVGQREESALAMLGALAIGLASQYPAGTVSFYLLDGAPADSPLAGQLQQIAARLPHPVTAVEWREVEAVVARLAGEVTARHERDQFDGPAVYLLIYGMQRYRMLRKNDDDFGFSMDENKPARPGKQFADILREGPAVGIHAILWADTMATLERSFDRATLREFDHRILFQLSASDSSNLIDTPAANTLGQHRALLYSEEQGTVEKFRPYAHPPADWLAGLFVSP